MFVKETEEQDKSSDSDDNVPVASYLRPKTLSTLTYQQIEDCKTRPQVERAIGVTVAKWFDGVKCFGQVDRFRTVRKRCVYHVTYTDGDEEEMSQIELRDGYLLGLSDEIEAQWNSYNLGKKGTTKKDKQKDKADKSDGEASAEEGSVYGASSEEDYMRRAAKTRRKEKCTKSKRGSKKQELSGHLLPQAGEKTVAAEAYGKLTIEQQRICAAKINWNTKKVILLLHFLLQCIVTSFCHSM